VPRLRGLKNDTKADKGFIGDARKNMNRKDEVSLRFMWVWNLGFADAEASP
jgi:hypothetical protein